VKAQLGIIGLGCIGLHDIETRDRRSKRVNVVIDTPKGSQNKFKFDEKLGLFRLSRILPAGMRFPFDFGSVPRTRAEDGDALDVLVLMDAPTFPGCLVTVRLLGVLRAKQTEKRKTIRNDRLIAMAETPVNRPDIDSIDELGDDQLERSKISSSPITTRTAGNSSRRDGWDPPTPKSS
jgi:inorganic pyrophosphatase